MNKLTGIKDLDREILGRVDDKELLTVCSVDKRMWNEVCDDNFLRRRLEKNHPDVLQYKETWKEFFLDVTHIIALMKEKYGYTYTTGNYKKQYKLLKNNKGRLQYLMLNAAAEGELPLVIYALIRMRKRDRSMIMKSTVEAAIEMSHLDIVKVLVDNGAIIKRKYIEEFGPWEDNPKMKEYLESKI